MTKIFAEAVAAISQLPEQQQDEIARLMMAMIGDDDAPEEIDPAHLPGVMLGLDQVRRGEFATDEEVDQAYRHFGGWK